MIGDSERRVFMKVGTVLLFKLWNKAHGMPKLFAVFTFINEQENFEMNRLIAQAAYKATPRSMMIKRELRAKSDRRAFIGSLLIVSMLAASFWF